MTTADRDGLTAHELTIVADLTYRQVDYWTRTDRLHCIGDNRPGSGDTRIFPTNQVALAVQMSRLTKAGIPMPQAADIAKQILEHGHADLPGFVLAPIQGPAVAGPALPDVVRHINRAGDAA